MLDKFHILFEVLFDIFVDGFVVVLFVAIDDGALTGYSWLDFVFY